MNSEAKNTEERRKNNRKNLYRRMDKLQKIIHVSFTDKSLLKTALTHRSWVNESGKHTRDNERLEYLGDSVLALIVNEYLFRHFSDYREGNLAKIKSAAVSETTLAKIAREINLGSFILMGKGEEKSGGAARPSLLANTMEALIGAIYLDSGFKQCRKFVLSMLKNDIERIDKLTYMRDPKTTLQEFVQKKYKDRPIYNVVNEQGPDHDKKFTVVLSINGREVMIGTGSSKRRAEMNAAGALLQKIDAGEDEI